MTDNNSIYPKLIGSGIAGILESLIFHPADTISKRLMSNQDKIIISGNNSNLRQNIISTQINTTANQQIRGLYNGLGFCINGSFHTTHVWLWWTTFIKTVY